MGKVGENQRDHEKAILPHPRSAHYLRAPKSQFPTSIIHSERRFAPETVRQDRKGVRQGLELVSDRIGIRIISFTHLITVSFAVFASMTSPLRAMSIDEFYHF